ncbi:MAG: hypothetical protein M1820_003815 [Bogoriella megaspora]|nr:MAG: hypothetical protein M1820_003815 [Bogoriella megaspora]
MAESTCCMCNAPAGKKCTECHSAIYCSKVCQRKDWALHKILCKDVKEMRPRPSDKHALRILLPENDARPKILWVKREGARYYGPKDSMDLLGDMVGQFCFSHNELRHFNLPNDINLLYRENFFNDGSKPNQAVSNITKGACPHDWRGPIIVDALYGHGDSMSRDVMLSDLRHVVDTLVTYAKQDVIYEDRVHIHGTHRCIQISYEDTGPVRVRSDHLIFRSPISRISALVNLPLRARGIKLPDQAIPITPQERFDARVFNMKWLFLVCNPEDPRFGSVPEPWNSGVTEWIIAHQDRKDLNLKDLKVLLLFIRKEVLPRLSAAKGGDTAAKAEAEAFITEENFKAFVDAITSKAEVTKSGISSK